MWKFCLLFVPLFATLVQTYGAKILFVAPPGSASHRKSLYPLAESLAASGHSVTMFTELFEDDGVTGKNLTNKNILLNIEYDKEDMEKTLNDMIWNSKSFTPLMMFFPWMNCGQMTSALLEQKREEFDKILKEDWDLIFVDALFTPTGLLFAEAMNKPYVLYQTTAIGIPESVSRSIPYPSSSFPALFLNSVEYDQKNFLDRLGAAWSEISYLGAIVLINTFVVRYRFGSEFPGISVNKFYGEADSSFVEYPLNLDYPHPLTTGVIAIGGRCKTGVLKDQSLLDFVENPKSKGTIVVAFGHMVKWNGTTKIIRRNFAQAMNALKDYRIVWQYEGEPEIKMEPHVRTMAWVPQTELLNHPKTKVLVGHGGLKSIMESICGEVPMLLVPFFAEQVHNGFLLKRAKAGETMSKFELSDDNIENKIRSVASNEIYKQSIIKLKWSILDKPLSPSDNAGFWTDFMIRRHGLPKKFFRLKGSEMGFVKYFCVDILVSFSSLFVLVLVVTVKISLKMKSCFK